MKKICEKENVMICQYDLVPFVEKINDNAIILGETNTFMIERNCILMNNDEILKNGLLRIEYKEKAKGVTIGYLEVGYNEYVVLKSYDRLLLLIVYISIFLLVALDFMMLVSGAYNKNGKEVPNKELEKLLLYSNKSIMQQLLKFIQNDLTTSQIQKFISMKSFEKTFKDKEYQCTFKFIFSSFGDLILEVVKFGKRDMYKEMKQQQFKNLESGIFGNDHSIF